MLSHNICFQDLGRRSMILMVPGHPSTAMWAPLMAAPSVALVP